uniref:Wall-associated receptor kinase galacturonan-binding domain-containing protein n=1 Tax=Oryza punctata TaxID=4537 RepID=A0A0E0K2T3_ORYPU
MNFLLALAIAGLVLVSLPSLSHCDDNDDIVGPRRGRELAADECTPSGTVELKPNRNPKCQGCCKRNQTYPTYDCSPPTSTSRTTKAVMTLHDFDPLAPRGNVDTNGGFPGGALHGVVFQPAITLSKGYPDLCQQQDRNRPGECDSQDGCNVGTYYLPPCGPNIIAASPAVWEILGLGATGNETYRKHNVTLSDIRG